MTASTAARPTPSPWLVAFGLFALVALYCLYFQVSLPGKLATNADYEAVAQVLAQEAQPGDVVTLAPWWTERARLFLPEGLTVDGHLHSAQDDYVLHPRIWVLAEPNLPKAGMYDFWSVFRPGRTEDGAARTFGNLTLQRFKNGRAREVLFDARSALGQAQGYVERGDQRQPAPLAASWNEVLFAPRRCIRLDAPGPGQRRVAEFQGVPASNLVLSAGYIWDKGAFYEGVTDAELTVEIGDQRRSLVLRRKDEGLKTLDLGPVPAGTTVRVASSAANPHERALCFELYGFGGAR